nr:AraC family transcriptional regulator [Bradyrhizobium sp.]
MTGYVDVAESLGLDARRLIKKFGLHGLNLSDANTLIPAGPAAELLEHSAAVAGAEDFGLRMAAKRSLAHLGPIGLVAREQPTLRHALRMFERHFRLYSETVILRLEDHDGVASLSFQLVMATSGRLRQVIEAVVGAAFRTVDTLAGNAWIPDGISFSHPAPQGRTIHNSFFNTRPHFGNGFDGILLRAADLDAPISTADPVMARYVRQYLDAMIAQPDLTIDATVRQLVFTLLPSGRCTSDGLASHLGLNRRTLHRRLALRGETVSTIINDARIELAQRHVKTERRSLTETAQLLGFSGLPTFSRWFQRQFGSSATTWRKTDIPAPTRGAPTISRVVAPGK